MQLPIDSYLDDILNLLRSKQNILVQSSPGSGKTTRIPPYLTQNYKNIWVIEPRRIAAIYAASRIAEENKWPLGKNVGYEVRFESRRSANTSIVFMTEALLAKKILANPELNGVDLIIFDEFHERSYWTDLAIGHIRELQILGSAIQLLFLSATIDKTPLLNFFENDMGIIDIELPRFPIEVIYQKKPLRYSWTNEFEINFLAAIQEILQKGKRQILVFLPGLKEIRSAGRLLENQPKFKQFQIQVLHGSIPLSIQKNIVTNEDCIEQRIILSTNIAESSLTISGVTAVLDSGLQREASYNSDYEVPQLSTRKISLFSAIQRQGRANRLGPGVCFKMWTELDERSMEKAPISDVKKSSLFDLGLHLIHLGHWPLSQFTWFETPSAHTLTELESNYLHARLCHDKKLTPLGELALELNLNYESAVFLLLSHCFYYLDKSCLLIALLESEYSADEAQRITHSTLLDAADDIGRGKNYPADIDKRASQLLAGFSKGHSHFNWMIESRRLFQTPPQKIFLDYLESQKKSHSLLDCLLAFSFLNRVCRRRKHEAGLSFRAITTNGKEVQLGDQNKTHLLPPQNYFLNFKTIVDATQTARCHGYHFIDESVFNIAVRPFCETVSRVEFNEPKQHFYKVSELVLKKLSIETLGTEPLPAQELKDKTKDILWEQLEKLVFSIPSVEEFLNRVSLVNSIGKQMRELNWNEIIEQEVKKGLSLKNRSEWNFDLESYLPYEDQKQLRNLVPREFTLKSLNRIFKIHYLKNETPMIEARLQHFLGINAHPSILDNQLKLKIVLLGPHGRPIQITNDLPGFWKTSYPEIRKEMKGRYPKHAWPEDPTTFKN